MDANLITLYEEITVDERFKKIELSISYSKDNGVRSVPYRVDADCRFRRVCTRASKWVVYV